jgi:hypothetical protein
MTAGLLMVWHEMALCQPATLYLHSAIYDPPRQRMVVFAGWDGRSETNDAWQLSLGRDPTWGQLAPAGDLPPKRFGHSAVFDSARDRMIVFGGEDSTGNVLSDVWALSLADTLTSDTPTWNPVPTSGAGPPAREFHTAIYDPLRDRMLVYGGRDAFHNPSGEVWCLWLATPTARWERLPTKGGSVSLTRYLHSAIYDPPPRDRMLVFGGDAPYNDVWALSPGDTMVWTHLDPSGSLPVARSNHSAIYDPNGDRMIVFGGNSGNTPLDDVWQLSLAGARPAWAPSDPPSTLESPSGRYYHSAIYDTAYRRMVVFGGSPDVSEPTWAFSEDMQWSPFRPVVQVSETELSFPTVTIGDTASVPFMVSNLGLKPLQVSAVQLPAATWLSPPVLPELAWRESVPETLFLAAAPAQPTQFSLTIVSNDPIVPRRVQVRADVRDLAFDMRVFGDPELADLGDSLLVVVTPRPGVRIESGFLYYRIAGTSEFDSLSLKRLTVDFIATIPAAAVTEHGVEYYVRVENCCRPNTNSPYSATQPAGAPATVDTQAVAGPTSFTAVPRPNPGPDFLVGDSIYIDVRLPAGTVFRSGVIHYRQGGEQSFESDTLTMGVPGPPVGIIPGRVVGPQGVEYWIEVTTLEDTLQFPRVGSPPERIPIRVENLVEVTEHPAARYRLLSVPLDFSATFQGSLDALLFDQFGAYDTVNWRAYAYDSSAGGNIEFSSADIRFKPVPGRAFWLISREAHRVDTKPIAGFSTSTEGEYSITLKQGWNLFGNPFDFPVEWNAVRRDTTVVSDPVAFDPALGKIGAYAEATPSVLAPFEGYFIHATQAATLWVAARKAPTPVAPGAALIAGSAASEAGNLWCFRLQGSNEQAVDGSNLFGVHTAAAEGFDRLDLLKPPAPPGPWVRVAFAHSDWQERSGQYRQDLRGPGSEGETWEIEVRSSTPGDPVTLDLTEMMPAPPGLAMRLIDREQSSWVDLSLGTPGGGPHPVLQRRIESFGPHPYRLAIVTGSEGYVADATRQALTVPGQVSLDPSAPNPFRTATRIRFGLPRAERVTLEIYSVLGQRVAVPFDRAPLGPGYHTAVWDGRITGGGLAPSGVYLVRLLPGGEALTRRVVLVR